MFQEIKKTYRFAMAKLVRDHNRIVYSLDLRS